MDFITLAQVTDDLLMGFLDQIPSSLVVMVCGSGLLLFAAFAWFAYFKPLRKARKAKQETTIAPSAPIPAPEAPLEALPEASPEALSEAEAPIIPQMADDEDDLPDLDLLMGGEVALAPEPTPEPQPEPEPIIPPVATVDAPAPLSANPRAVALHTGHRLMGEPVLQVMRDGRDGRLVVVMDGVGYRSLAEQDGLKKQFIQIMRDLNQVVTQPDDNPPMGEPDAPLEPVYRPASTDDYVPGKLPSFKLEDNMTPTNKGSYEVTAVPELNIAEAIEAYLQHKIRNTPEYRGRVIHVQPALGGGVRIQVDNDYYEAVSDIADADVRGFIQQAIQEWQNLNS